ncbi:MAG: lipid-transfer protein [Chloroflexi bacterium]|nr:lipid-transfer protein [Chloroflexota bacterium]MCI0857063.1 lipid-transfer protein [Chloroflexota bacterium]
MTIRNKAAIVGIGQTEFSKDSGRSTLHMALESILEALADAGLEPKDVDGVVKMAANDDVYEIDLLRSLNLPNLRFFNEVPHGGGAACGTIAGATAAVVSGMADVVITFRSLNERSERRFGESSAGGGMTHWRQYTLPHGLVTPAQWVAIFGQRYLHEYGYDTTEFGHVSVLTRKHAATNPHAMMYERPITLEDHQNSRWITEPLRLLDCCLDTDGACAAIVVSAEKAKQLKSAPAYIAAAAQGTGSRSEMMTSYQRESLARLEESEATAAVIYPLAELEPKDIDVAEIYDPFTPMVLMQLEAFGFAERGKSPELFRDGKLELDGETPMNTHGGHLGEGYLHGFGHIVEGVRQIRGTAVNQIANVKTCLVTSGVGVPTSAMILSKEPY